MFSVRIGLHKPVQDDASTLEGQADQTMVEL